MMLLVHEKAIPAVSSVLGERYYRPEGKPESILHCRPISGSSVLFRRTE
jgi:hypothetical protein